MTGPQRLDATALFLCAAILGHERAVQLPVDPGDFRTDRLVECEAAPDMRHVEVHAGRKQYESVPGGAVARNRRKCTLAEIALVNRRDVFGGPAIHGVARGAGHGRADQG